MSKSDGNWEGSYRIGWEPLVLQGLMTVVGLVSNIKPKSSLAFEIRWLLGFLQFSGMGIMSLHRMNLGGRAHTVGAGAGAGGGIVAGVGGETAWPVVVGLADAGVDGAGAVDPMGGSWAEAVRGTAGGSVGVPQERAGNSSCEIAKPTVLRLTL